MEPNETFYEQTAKTLTFRIQRFDPGQDKGPRLQEYSFPVSSGMTVLESLIWIKEKIDGSLSFRASCRMGVCGSCGMFINGFPRLACQTQVWLLRSDVIEVKSLPNYPIIKDLVPDLTAMFQKHKSVKPFIIRKDVNEMEKPTREYKQSPKQLEDYLQFSYCLKCGICLSACPTVATDRQFTGPQALAQAFRYNSDCRDEGSRERTGVVDKTHGIWRCHMAGACAEACPKGVDPAMAIQLLKRKTVFKSQSRASSIVPPLTGAAKKPNIQGAPAPTV